jgi:hypothetical protein
MEAQHYTLQAPSGSLNLIDPIDALPENDARELKNIFPTGQKAKLRGGLDLFCSTGQSANVRSMFTLPLASGTTKVVACVNNKIMEVSTGTASNITGGTVPTLNDWQGDIFGHNLYLCNGTDTAQIYNGTTVSDCNFTGVAESDLINVSSYKEHLWFVEVDTASAWYHETAKSTSGALVEFDLSYYLRLGGFLLFAGSYTDRLGETTTDLFMFASSEGELLFYAGIDPSTIWQLAARYVIPKPLGYNSFVRVENDIWIITESGIIPVSGLFSGGTQRALDSVGYKVNPLIAEKAVITPYSHLWRGTYWGGGGRVYISIPTSGSTVMYLVCNLDTGGWCTYEYAADSPVSITIFNGYPYMGGTAGKIYKAEANKYDNGDPIPFRIKGPWSFFGARNRYKRFHKFRPLMYGKRGTSLSYAMNTDFRDTGQTSTINLTGGVSTPWYSAWYSAWSSSAEYLYDTYGLSGQGHSGSLVIEGTVSGAPLEFSAFDIGYEAGSMT